MGGTFLGDLTILPDRPGGVHWFTLADHRQSPFLVRFTLAGEPICGALARSVDRDDDTAEADLGVLVPGTDGAVQWAGEAAGTLQLLGAGHEVVTTDSTAVRLVVAPVLRPR